MPLTVGIDSYATDAEASEYLANQPQDTSQWSALPIETRRNWLRTARVEIDKAYVWEGDPTSTTQSLPWPRKGLMTENGAVLPSDAIPDWLRDANIEQAWRMSIKDTRDNNRLVDQGVVTLPGGLTFNSRARRKPIYDVVDDMIPFIYVKYSTHSGFQYSDIVRL